MGDDRRRGHGAAPLTVTPCGSEATYDQVSNEYDNAGRKGEAIDRAVSFIDSIPSLLAAGRRTN